MNNIKQLELKKLFKELEYVESDFELRNEVINEADSDFLSKVNIFLNEHPELKELYDKKITNTLNLSFINIERSKINVDNSDIDGLITIDRSPKIKKLYRDIVKLTHPDKNGSAYNNFYIKATEFYNNNDIIELFKICQYLNIEFTIDDNDNDIIKNKIIDIKNRIDLLESTVAWQWLNINNESEKDQLLFNFIKMRIK